MTSTGSRLTIVVNNYNYGRFLAAAIDSALAQTRPCEVVVVDDGSTDESRDVLRRYGDRVVAVLQPNAGQASAYNAGVAAARGDFVLFLDSDDVLLPETAERVVRAFERRPRAAKVQFRMSCVDAEGRPLGRTLPLEGDVMDDGVLPPARRRFRAYLQPPGSGHVYPRWVLDRLFPMPAGPEFRRCADMYPSQLAVALGEIVSLPDAGALYRIHGANYTAAQTSPDLARIREHFPRIEIICRKQRELDPTVAGLSEFDLWSLDMLSWRALSRKLGPEDHPFREGLLSLCARGVRRAMAYPGVGARARLRYAAWFLALTVLPGSVCWRLALWWRRREWEPRLRSR